MALPQPLQVDQRQRLFHLLLAAAILPGQAEADVLGYRQVRKESVILEDHADDAASAAHWPGPIEQVSPSRIFPRPAAADRPPP
jgi:hypothetical protein